MKNYSEKIKEIATSIKTNDTILIGAGAGLSTSAGFEYSESRFNKYFSDFTDNFGIKDMYSGGFYTFPTPEITWAWWSRSIWLNRYAPASKPVYKDLLALVKNKNYFVLTTNVDHQFQQAGFEKKRLFYMQGDFGLWQSTLVENNHNYDNFEQVKKMVLSQGFEIDADNNLVINGPIKMAIPSFLVPTIKGRPVKMNLRIDKEFLEDKGWHEASERYTKFVKNNLNKRLLLLELGVGANTPGIIKYPFWQFTAEDKEASLVSISKNLFAVPAEIKSRTLEISEDIGKVLKDVKKELNII